MRSCIQIEYEQLVVGSCGAIVLRIGNGECNRIVIAQMFLSS